MNTKDYEIPGKVCETCGKPATSIKRVWNLDPHDIGPVRYLCLQCDIKETDDASESLAWEMSRS